MARGLLRTLQRLEQVRPPRGQTTLAAGSKYSGRPKAASEPADQTAPRFPEKELRSWGFVPCFLGVGLSIRFAELATFGLRPFWAFTIGVLINVPLAHALSAIVFSDDWARI